MMTSESRAAVKGAEAGAHELLEQIGLFVRALGGAEPGQRALAVAVAYAPESLGGEVERLLPCGLAEMRVGVGRVNIGVVLGHTFSADQRLGQSVGVVGIVEAEPPLDA